MRTSAAPPRVSGDAALRIAQADAEKVYRINLALEADGWHISV